MKSIIQAKNLHKSFGSFTAVDSISFDLFQGEFLGLLGPNGAGKTTTIRMLYGFSPMSEGTLTLFEQDIRSEWRSIKSRIGVCQQENTLDPDLTVEQNLLIFARYFSMPGKQARKKAEELLDFFALTHKRGAKVMELSGGMARRLILARALINSPELLILDEPTTGLDPQSRHQVWEKLEALKKQGLTVLLTTHYMEEASRLCDRIVLVDHGKVLVEGSPQELISRYAKGSVMEIEEPSEELKQYVAKANIEHEDLQDRLVLYTENDSGIQQEIRSQFCVEKCTFRNSSLEDVFLRLTGRELRE